MVFLVTSRNPCRPRVTFLLYSIKSINWTGSSTLKNRGSFVLTIISVMERVDRGEGLTLEGVLFP